MHGNADGNHRQKTAGPGCVCTLHDNALTQYIQEEFHNDISHVDSIKELPHAGAHCVMGEQNIKTFHFIQM